MRVLILNQDFTFLGFCNWQVAINLTYCLGKAIIEENYSQEVHSVSLTMKIPAVIRLKKYVRVAFEKIAFVSYSKHNVHIRDSYICSYCGVKFEPRKLTIDHVLPESQGGKTTWENCTTACNICNGIKDDRTPKEAGMKLLKIPTKPHGFKMILKMKLGEINELWKKYLDWGVK